MKNAIGYARISTADQSNFSISGQQEYIIQHCTRNEWHLLDFFLDEGQSAKNFDRANWKALEKYIKANFKKVDYLVVSKYDRFSRNVAEALNMIDTLEKKYNIKVISVMEPIALHPDSPYYFQFRTQMLLGADVELRVIRDRTRFGMVSAAKNGRYIAKAPRGYKNERDSQNKPILTIDDDKAKLIRQIFNLYLTGMPLAEIKEKMKSTDLLLTANGAIASILRNHVYAGLIKVPSYYDEPERLVKGLHQGLVSEEAFYTVQNMLNGKKQVHTTYNEAVPLRGILRCQCGRIMTAGNSKGRTNYYWYYYCQDHKINFNSNRIHGQILEVLYNLKMDDNLIERTIEKLKVKFKARFTFRANERKAKQAELNKVNEKIESVELKYICNDLDVISYRKWHPKLLAERANIIKEIEMMKMPNLEKIEHLVNNIGDLCGTYENSNIYRKQSIIKMLFGENLTYEKGIYRTTFLNPLFASKALILKEKQLLEIQETASNNGKNPLSAPEQILNELILFAELLAA